MAQELITILYSLIMLIFMVAKFIEHMKNKYNLGF